MLPLLKAKYFNTDILSVFLMEYQDIHGVVVWL